MSSGILDARLGKPPLLSCFSTKCCRIIPNFLRLVLFAVVFWPQIGQAFPWSTDMFRGQFVRPMERTPRNQPAGTLAENALPPMSREAAATRLHNPFAPTQQVLSKGRFLYLTDCAPCHDSKGTGKGPVIVVLDEQPKSLVAGEPTKLTDGAIFATIRHGFKAMPSYGDTMSTGETWQLVSFVRYLQAHFHRPPDRP
jgi:mono/diheme cytochrome c family protein